tara:strand:+ start:325 stop:597 length:273 start_codon:yes stop_codon:yes gene_type:complete
MNVMEVDRTWNLMLPSIFEMDVSDYPYVIYHGKLSDRFGDALGVSVRDNFTFVDVDGGKVLIHESPQDTWFVIPDNNAEDIYLGITYPRT